MAFILLGGLAGFVLGSVLAQLLFGPPATAAARGRRGRPGHPGAAFLLLTVTMFGGMAAGGLVGTLAA